MTNQSDADQSSLSRAEAQACPSDEAVETAQAGPASDPSRPALEPLSQDPATQTQLAMVQAPSEGALVALERAIAHRESTVLYGDKYFVKMSLEDAERARDEIVRLQSQADWQGRHTLRGERIAALEAELATVHIDLQRANARVAVQEAELQRAKADLLKYGWHIEKSCPVALGADQPCSCGFDAATGGGK